MRQAVVAPFALALLLSASLLTIFTHGLLGLGSWFTAVALVVLLTMLVLRGLATPAVMTTADRLALVLAASCALSVALQPAAGAKHIVLLALSLSAYAAARGLAGMMQSRAFITTLCVMVAAGSVITAFALSDIEGKPTLFGYDHGGVQVAMLLALVAFALACSQLPLALAALAIAPPLAIVAAAQVRFAVAVMIACLVLGAVIAARPYRIRFVVIAAIAVVAVLSGALARRSMTMEYVRYAEESFGLKAAPRPPQGERIFQVPGEAAPRIQAPLCPEVNINNSIDLRKRLYSEAFALLPQAGLTGIGLEKFAELSCLKMELHNTLLQVAIELGLVPAGLLAALMAAAAWPLWKPARTTPDALLALVSLSYAALISMGSGRITEDFFLFLMIGYAVGTGAGYKPPLE